MNKSFEYSGRDNLDVMALAKNYNNSIRRFNRCHSISLGRINHSKPLW